VEPDDHRFWFDATPLERGSAVRRLGALRPGGDQPVRAFAEANGLDFHATARAGSPGLPELPGLYFGRRCTDVVATRTAPYVELGNLGWRFVVATDFEPHRRGYVAVRHDLPLPHVFCSARGSRGLSATGVLSTVAAVASLLDENAAGDDDSPLGRFRRGATELDPGPTATGVRPYCRKGEEHRARALLTGDALALLEELAADFDVELHDSWLFAYARHGDVSTRDPAVWAWAFSAASRMVDLARVLAGLLPGGATVPPSGDPPFYTARRVARPARAEALRLRKRSR